jgi:TDG/mug DNA glycosylase family protein
VIRPGLSILFVGLNPGLYTAAIGHHFAHPSNRFWPALVRSGLVPEWMTAWTSRRLLDFDLGITTLVPRATARADELSPEELRRGARRLIQKIRRARPKIAAFLGLGLYRVAFHRPRARLGAQRARISSTCLWVLPNPSGLNARFQIPDYVRLFRRLGKAAGILPPRARARRRSMRRAGDA